ncbi:MAG: hypothetical protein R3D26_15355 [Cyanobacteriota/Melainabacteria group bacterium]
MKQGAVSLCEDGKIALELARAGKARFVLRLYLRLKYRTVSGVR